MTQPKVAAQRRAIQSRVRSSLNLLSEAKAHGMHPFQIDRVAEVCALRVFIAWEVFLEGTFLRYMCGAGSMSGVKPACCASPRDLGHAWNLVCGQSGREFIDWASPTKVIGRSELYFVNGEPYKSAISPAIVQLTDFRVVRNRIAHDSEPARKDFAKMVRGHFGHAFPGMAPGKLLMTVNRSRTGSLTYLEYWSETVDTVAQLITG